MHLLLGLLLDTRRLKYGIQPLLITALCISIVSTSAIAALSNDTNDALTLQNALSKALSANPEVTAALHEREAVEGIRLQAGKRLNPSLSTLVQDTRHETRQTTLAISQEIELGDKRSARLEAANLFFDKASIEIEHKKTQIHADVVAAFYEVLAAQERLNLAKSSLDVANLSLDAASKRVRAGKISPVEETKSRIAQSTAKIEMHHANSQLNRSRQQLSTLWGEPVATFKSAAGQLAAIPNTASLPQLLAMLDNAPATKIATIEVNTRDAITKIERSKAIPNITVSAGFVNNQELNGRNQALLGLSIPIPLFDQNKGNVQEAISRKYKAEDTLIALKNQLSTNLAAQHDRLSTAKQASESLRDEILPSARSAFNAANKGFSAGKFDFLDVLDAQRTLFQAQSQYIRALLEAHHSIAEIERILGDVIAHNVQE
jgi:outer membrane protein, heavy metal efflux system